MTVSRHVVLVLKAALVAALSLLLALALAAHPAGAAGPGGEPGDDVTPPTVVAHLPDGRSASGWYRTDAQVTVRASDNTGGSGIMFATYTLSGATVGQGHIASSGTTFVLSNPGATTITLQAEDRDGNVGDATAVVRIDKVLPEATVTGPLATNGQQFSVSQAVVANYSCADALSGIASCAGSVANGAFIDTSTVGVKTFQVVAQDRAGNESTVTRTYEVLALFKSTSRPSIAGDPVVGASLTGTPGAWSPTPDTQTCEWVRDPNEYGAGGTVVQATGAPFTVTAAVAGASIVYRCTARKAGYYPTYNWSTAVTILQQFELADFELRADGGLQVGKPVSIDHPEVAGATFSYQWYSGDDAIAGATGPTFVPGPEQLGSGLRAQVTLSGTGYRTKLLSRAAEGTVQPRPFTVGANPAVSGAPRAGQVLRATGPGIAAAGSGPLAPYALTWQWLRNGSPIRGATASSYRLTAADVGRRISVRMDLSGAGYQPASRTSPSSAVARAVAKVRARATSRRSRTVRLAVTVRAPGVAATGRVRVLRGGKTVGLGVVRKGAVRILLKRQQPGRARYVVRYDGSAAIKRVKVPVTVRVRR